MLGKENTKGSMVGTGRVYWPRECISALPVLLKPTVTNGKGRTR
jgi:hypothetical protein